MQTRIFQHYPIQFHHCPLQQHFVAFTLSKHFPDVKCGTLGCFVELLCFPGFIFCFRLLSLAIRREVLMSMQMMLRLVYGFLYGVYDFV